MFLSDKGIIGGYKDGEFKGANTVKRAEAAKFLLKAANIEVEEVFNNGRFSDVLDDQWYAPYVLTAANHGIIKGYDDGTFKPGNEVNTVEFLKMLSITFSLQENLPYYYSDVSDDAWFAKYAGLAEEYNLFPDRDDNLLYDVKLTREEIAVAIYQYLISRCDNLNNNVDVYYGWSHRNRNDAICNM